MLQLQARIDKWLETWNTFIFFGIFAAVLVALLLFSGSANAATSTHVRLLLHGTHTNIDDTGFGIAGWLIAPSITDAPSKWVGLLGPRYDGDGWNVELIGGGVIQNGDTTPLVDMRLELTPELWDVPLYAFSNLQLIDPGDKNALYVYQQVDYVLPAGIGLLGVETENVFGPEDDMVSIGPQVVVPLAGGRFVLVGAYQFHLGNQSQFWLRSVVNF